MVKGKCKQLLLAHQIGRINTIEFIQTLATTEKNRHTLNRFAIFNKENN